MTADELSRLIFRSRTTISKLENARCRPDVADVMKILDALGVTGDRWTAILTLAGQAADRGWWDAFGNTMGARQRMYADIESDANTIRGYYQVAVPGILQTPDFTQALVEYDKTEGPLIYRPDRMIEARQRRQQVALRSGGPRCDFILDEFVIRRLAVPPRVMSNQLRHLVETVSTWPHLTVRLLPVEARIEGGLARSTFTIYSFPDPDDPTMAIADTISADVVHTEPVEVTRYAELFERLRDATTSPARSLTLLEEAANELAGLAGS
ncbi:helix-turn-helix transcriptional regulator [Actinomadura sp. WMMB 499]|uniref:helix-turn-helix domain-containing protein n=1 Tax=Actinomadura sp. WMMB 499 TaxID=1219491 RepID=UPI0020C81E71|nr:helix-turn-helix transcriptional regulator [Actinomadura sp. WMMB 499]